MASLQKPKPYDPVRSKTPVPPPGHKSASMLEQALRRGWFAVTAELNPPDSADPQDVLKAAEPLRDVADAINATDASGANCHMSSMGICSILSRAGLGIEERRWRCLALDHSCLLELLGEILLPALRRWPHSVKPAAEASTPPGTACCPTKGHKDVVSVPLSV